MNASPTTTTTTTASASNDVVASASTDSPVGALTIVVNKAGLRAITWADDDPRRCGLEGVELGEAGEHPLIDATCAQLAEYFAGDRIEFDLPLAPLGTEFQHAAWEALRQIPYGTTTTYGGQARGMGDVNKARAVGAANGKNPLSIVVPCHRVVGADGSLTGFAGGVDTKAWLLDHERAVLSRAS
ncbi:MAG: methylated-DNA--[protein]-cysteine S-methyltransferase [Actinomycetota bacterium]